TFSFLSTGIPSFLSLFFFFFSFLLCFIPLCFPWLYLLSRPLHLLTVPAVKSGNFPQTGTPRQPSSYPIFINIDTVRGSLSCPTWKTRNGRKLKPVPPAPAKRRQKHHLP